MSKLTVSTSGRPWAGVGDIGWVFTRGRSYQMALKYTDNMT